MSLPVNAGGSDTKRNGVTRYHEGHPVFRVIFYEKKQYTHVDCISNPHRRNHDCRLYAKFHKYFCAVKQQRGFVIHPVLNRDPAGRRDQRSAVRHRTLRYTTRWRNEWYSTLRYSTGWNDEWHSAIRCCIFGNNAVRHSPGNAVEKTGYEEVAGGRDQPFLFFSPAVTLQNRDGQDLLKVPQPKRTGPAGVSKGIL